MRSTIAAIIVILTCLRKAQRLRLYFKMGSSLRRLVQEIPQQTEEQQRRQKITNPPKQVTFEVFGDQLAALKTRSLSFLLEVEVVGEAFNLIPLAWRSMKHTIPITTPSDNIHQAAY